MKRLDAESTEPVSIDSYRARIVGADGPSASVGQGPDPSGGRSLDPVAIRGGDPAAGMDRLGREPARPRRSEATVGRSFVVELAPGPGSEEFRGRVQHLATHDGGNFSSVEMLVSIIRRVLGRDGSGDG